MTMPEDEYWEQLREQMRPYFSVHFSEVPSILGKEDTYTMPSDFEPFTISDTQPAREWFDTAVGDWPAQPWLPTDFDEWCLRSMGIDPL